MKTLERAQHGCTFQVQKPKERVLNAKSSVDLKTAMIFTEVFTKTEGEPTVILCEKLTNF